MTAKVRVAARFQRAIRIDADMGDAGSLEGYICTHSTAEVLLATARHVSKAQQCAFTWTGPYGSGKSSLMLLLSGLLSGNAERVKLSEKIAGRKVAASIHHAMSPGTDGWKVLPVVGHRGSPKRAIVEAARAQYPDAFVGSSEVSDKELIDGLLRIAGGDEDKHGGLLLFVDEMGKFLEAATHQRTDIYIFQQLAEAAARSHRRFIVIGTLHQSFAEYANRMSRDARDEWTKIQGRYVDLAVNIAGEEQVALLASAIETDLEPPEAEKLARRVGRHIRKRQPAAAQSLDFTLAACWPLHPATACLLGPISKRRFGQNQRSIFGFLNSAEARGFQHFLADFSGAQVYTVDLLWDYLRLNLEPSILASPDGHRWAIAVEAVERCESSSHDELELALLKTIALIDMFKERSSIAADIDLLAACIPGMSKSKVQQAVAKLKQSSLIIYRNFSATYAVFAGSDFDIEEAVLQAREQLGAVELSALTDLTVAQPILAKRHYHRTGSLQWFDLRVVELERLPEIIERFTGEGGVIGLFMLVVPTLGESAQVVAEQCRKYAKLSMDWDFVLGVSDGAWKISELTSEFLALQHVRLSRSELAGDPVARREVDARLGELHGRLESTLADALESSSWYVKGKKKQELSRAQLSGLASELADKRFPASPQISSELINRLKPSSSAIAAQKALLRRMVMNCGQAQLGIEGFPAEAGLLQTVLLKTGLYKQVDGQWQFVVPGADFEDCAGLKLCWDIAVDFLRANLDRSVGLDEILQQWNKPPFGIKQGLLPVLGVAFMLSQRDSLALYREGIFQSRLTDVDIDYLARDPSDIQLRWMDLAGLSRELIENLAQIVRDLAPEHALLNLEPIEVARGLVAIYEKLEPWTKRTAKLSRNATAVRGLLKHAIDPNKLLFNDIPGLVSQREISDSEDSDAVGAIVREGLEELVAAYPKSLDRLKTSLLSELLVPNDSPMSLKELRARGENAKGISDDFKVNAFAVRLAEFDGSMGSLESIASLAADKPTRDWTDADFNRALQNIGELAHGFLRAEAAARMHNRKEYQTSVHLLLGINGRTVPAERSIVITPHIRAQVADLKDSLSTFLNHKNEVDKEALIAALSELSAELIDGMEKSKAVTGER